MCRKCGFCLSYTLDDDDDNDEHDTPSTNKKLKIYVGFMQNSPFHLSETWFGLALAFTGFVFCTGKLKIVFLLLLVPLLLHLFHLPMETALCTLTLAFVFYFSLSVALCVSVSSVALCNTTQSLHTQIFVWLRNLIVHYILCLHRAFLPASMLSSVDLWNQLQRCVCVFIRVAGASAWCECKVYAARMNEIENVPSKTNSRHANATTHIDTWSSMPCRQHTAGEYLRLCLSFCVCVFFGNFICDTNFRSDVKHDSFVNCVVSNDRQLVMIVHSVGPKTYFIKFERRKLLRRTAQSWWRKREKRYEKVEKNE